jgi:hypothetical protein
MRGEAVDSTPSAHGNMGNEEKVSCNETSVSHPRPIVRFHVKSKEQILNLYGHVGNSIISQEKFDVHAHSHRNTLLPGSVVFDHAGKEYLPILIAPLHLLDTSTSPSISNAPAPALTVSLPPNVVDVATILTSLLLTEATSLLHVLIPPQIPPRLPKKKRGPNAVSPPLSLAPFEEPPHLALPLPPPGEVAISSAALSTVFLMPAAVVTPAAVINLADTVAAAVVTAAVASALVTVAAAAFATATTATASVVTAAVVSTASGSAVDVVATSDTVTSAVATPLSWTSLVRLKMFAARARKTKIIETPTLPLKAIFERARPRASTLPSVSPKKNRVNFERIPNYLNEADNPGPSMQRAAFEARVRPALAQMNLELFSSLVAEHGGLGSEQHPVG